MTHAIALPGSARNHAQLPDSLDRYQDIAGTYPDAVPIWVRLPRFDTDRRAIGTALSALYERDITPMLYVEDDEGVPLTTYAEFARFVDVNTASSIIVRFQQEPNGKPLDGRMRWRALAPRHYIDQWHRFADAMRDHTTAKLAYCVVVRQREYLGRIDAYFPGTDHVDIMGYDTFARSMSSRFIRRHTRRTRQRLRALHPTAPQYLMEYGVQRGIGSGKFRRAWMRSVEDVPGLDGAVYLNLSPNEHHDGVRVDWRMGRKMMRAHGRMVLGR